MAPETTTFRLRFPEAQVRYWADRYSYPEGDALPQNLAPTVKTRGFMTRAEFLALCEWKTPRSRPLVRSNSSEHIQIATRIALRSSDEETKVSALRLLRGVSWPTASVILHFCDQGQYPVLDFRALWSLGHARPPAYNVNLWLAYTEYARRMAATGGHSMRTVDRALWQFSSERQRR